MEAQVHAWVSPCGICGRQSGTGTGFFQVFGFPVSIIPQFPQGSTFVGTGSGAPEVPELPSARGYSRATRPQGDINSGDWSSRLGVGRRANIPASLKNLLFRNPKKYAGRI
jgi:hypothetical protein